MAVKFNLISLYASFKVSKEYMYTYLCVCICVSYICICVPANEFFFLFMDLLKYLMCNDFYETNDCVQ